MKILPTRLQVFICFFYSCFSTFNRATTFASTTAFRNVVILIFIFSLSFPQFISAQSAVSDNWSKPNLLSWDSTWKYQPGKAIPEYFKRDFNDDKWQPVNYQFLDTLTAGTATFKNIGTFRRKFFMPDSLKGKAVDLFFNVFGVCEIYFDGKPVFRKGRMHDPVSNYFVYQRTVPLLLDSLPWHVVTIYYASTISPRLAHNYNIRGIGMTLVTNEPKSRDDNDTYHHMLISFGIIAGFALFFWFVFAFYPNRISSLISALMLTHFSLIFFGALIRDINDPSVSQFIVGEKLWEIGFSTVYGWFLLYIYAAFYKKLRRYNFLVIVLICTSDILIISESSNWLKVSVVFMGLYVIESWRMIILGLIRHKTGFGILAAGFFLSIAGTILVIFNLLQLFPGHITPLQTVLGVATDLCFPLTLALHLAWEFGSANRELRKKLVQVNELSAKNLAQESEKQQILSSQNETLERQVHERTGELEQSIVELKSAQGHLIQSEKMASLGQLTAGIAHEIQNPLNFVNNFSEVNEELIGELVEEVDKGNKEEAKAIASDLKQNLQKVAHHGKRADAIVKGMLQHSRSTSTTKEPANINTLADEYLRIAYHGFRAKEKDFNATLKTDFDESISNINIIPQDIGRVLLNLYNNAFYAVNDKKKTAGDGYEPIVELKTKKVNDKIEIQVIDNGKGIPQNIADKIFQPFFTTKPTGQGTGLGLSLSYDIIKAHGGQLNVETKEGQGTSLIVHL